MKWFAVLLVSLMVVGCATVSERATHSDDPGHSKEDVRLELDVLSRLRDDALTSRHSFGVTALNGVVTLRGSVPDEITRHRALGVVRSTPGVIEVHDRLLR